MPLGYCLNCLLNYCYRIFSYRFSKGINHPISHSLHFGILRIARPLQLETPYLLRPRLGCNIKFVVLYRHTNKTLAKT